VVPSTGGHSATLQPVVHDLGSTASAPSHLGRVKFRLVHALDTAGDHEVADAALHLHRRVEHGLESRPAPAIDLQPGDT